MVCRACHKSQIPCQCQHFLKRHDIKTISKQQGLNDFSDGDAGQEPIAHAFDAMVMVTNCDKIVPGMLMAAARLNLPTIIVSGGPMLAGTRDGKKIDLVSVFEGVGAVTLGKMSEAELADIEDTACPTCGSCAGMFTANSMNCLAEAIGMGLPGNGTVPAVMAARPRLAKEAGMKIMMLLRKRITPRKIMTEKAFANAMTVDMALGCSTNTVLHLMAIAQEVGVKLDLWKIQGIICTHLVTGPDKKRIDYASKEFEQKHAHLDKLTDIVLNLPLSELTHWVGLITESAINQHQPNIPVRFKGQEALSDKTTKLSLYPITVNTEKSGGKDSVCIAQEVKSPQRLCQ